MSLLRKTNIGQELYDKAINEVSYHIRRYKRKTIHKKQYIVCQVN